MTTRDLTSLIDRRSDPAKLYRFMTQLHCLAVTIIPLYERSTGTFRPLRNDSERKSGSNSYCCSSLATLFARKQHSQFTYNVTLRRARVTTFVCTLSLTPCRLIFGTKFQTNLLLPYSVCYCRLQARPKRLYFHADIQGDSGGICNALGNDSMCDSKQKSSYEHESDFERLPR
jgi:hypothetical protein